MNGRYHLSTLQITCWTKKQKIFFKHLKALCGPFNVRKLFYQERPLRVIDNTYHYIVNNFWRIITNHLSNPMGNSLVLGSTMAFNKGIFFAVFGKNIFPPMWLICCTKMCWQTCGFQFDNLYCNVLLLLTSWLDIQ